MVEQVGYGDEEDGLFVVQAEVCDGSSEGGFSAGAGAAEDKPAIGAGCVFFGRLQGALPEAASAEFRNGAFTQCGEADVGQVAEVAVALETRT